MAKDDLQPFEIKFDGQLYESEDPTLIGPNFTTLKNLRYAEKHVKGIGGMSKINSTALANPHIQNGFHYKKGRPVESHTVVQAADSSDDNVMVYTNDTAIPSAGDFDATQIFVDNADGGLGRFSNAPFDMLAYANGKDACLWGGDETIVSRCLNQDSTGAFSYDFTDMVQNSLSDADNTAVLSLNGVPSGADSNTMLLLHLDNNVTDSAPSPHSPTNSGVTFDGTTKVFGTHSGVFDGASQISVADSADWDFSDGTFSIDARVRITSGSKDNTIFYQEASGSRSIWFYVNSSNYLCFQISNGLSNEIDITSSNTLSTDTWYHVAVVENGNNYYLFVDGIIKGTQVSIKRPSNYTSSIYIGSANSASYFTGYMDEIRISNIARWTTNFTVPSVAYGETLVTPYIYVGSILPIQGIKLYMGTGNLQTAGLNCEEWNGSAWTSCLNVSDGTASGGATLAQTGSITFDSTVVTSAPRAINQVVLYWYRIYPDATIDNGTSIYYITLDIPMQPIKDLWDGTLRITANYQVYKSSTYNDYTVNVFDDSFNTTNGATYVELDSLASTNYQVVGFVERQMGIVVHLIGGHVNTTSATTLTVSYWTGDSWAAVSNLSDGTAQSGISFAKSGTITWTPPDAGDEFQNHIANDAQFYIYKLAFDKTLSADVQVYYIGGIAAPAKIHSYSFPFHSKNRLWLCDQTDGDRNSAICSMMNSANVFNGDDSTTLSFGDGLPLTAATDLYSRLGSSIYNISLFFKAHEIWGVSGSTPEDFIQYRVSNRIGCVAPLTLVTTFVSVEGAGTKPVAIFQGADGVYMFDNSSVIPLHKPIDQYFDKRSSEAINSSMITNSVGFVDNETLEYHWLFANGSSTTLNKELVFDLKRAKWYEIDRGDNKALQCGWDCADTTGNTYAYGAVDSGYVERLENGNTFDGNEIVHTFETGEIPLHKGSMAYETLIRYLKLVGVAKTETANEISLTHYGDGKLTETKAIKLPATQSGYRIINTPHSDNLGDFVLHRFKFEMITTDETVGFEPIALVGFYKLTRGDLR